MLKKTGTCEGRMQQKKRARAQNLNIICLK